MELTSPTQVEAILARWCMPNVLRLTDAWPILSVIMHAKRSQMGLEQPVLILEQGAPREPLRATFRGAVVGLCATVLCGFCAASRMWYELNLENS